MSNEKRHKPMARMGRLSFWGVFALVAFLPLIWGIGIPLFLQLDPVAFEASQNVSTVAGLLAALCTIALTMHRLSKPMTGGFSYRTARDLTGFSLSAAIGRWLYHMDSLTLPPAESIAALSCEVGTGLAVAMAVYVSGRRSLRGTTQIFTPDRLPAVRVVMTLNAALICLMVASLLGVGLTARSAGRIEKNQGHRLAKLGERIAAQLAASQSPEEKRRVIKIWQDTKYVYPEIAAPRTKPSWLINPRRSIPTPYGVYVLSQTGERWHLAKRDIGQDVLYVGLAANVRPPVRAHDFALALVFLAALLFTSPLATWLASMEFRHALASIAEGLERLGQTTMPERVAHPSVGEAVSRSQLPGISIPGNDEAGDLAGELNDAFRVYERANQALLKELRLANRSTIAQNVFLKSTSQELFSPLEQIRTLCASLHETSMEAEQSADVEVIDQATVQLAEHVGEILKLSELDDWHEMPLQLTEFDMNDLAREVMVRLADRAQAGITAEIAAADDVPLIQADRKRVGQILSNLIENAFKYTPEGYVRVTTIKDRFDDGRPAVHVTVWDSGPGIPASDQVAIFAEFYRVSEQRDVPGTGLGLAIAYRLTERHHGKIWVESIIGEGSTFHLRLPISPRLEQT